MRVPLVVWGVPCTIAADSQRYPPALIVIYVKRLWVGAVGSRTAMVFSIR
jgi:hypothetical protein